MRWPFRRSAPAGDGPETAVDAAPAVEPAAPQAWRELEPLRTIAPVELTADGRRFSQGLGVRQPPDLALQPLGHNLSLEAPQGLVTNLARAVASTEPARPADGPAPPTAGRARRAATADGPSRGRRRRHHHPHRPSRLRPSRRRPRFRRRRPSRRTLRPPS